MAAFPFPIVFFFFCFSLSDLSLCSSPKVQSIVIVFTKNLLQKKFGSEKRGKTSKRKKEKKKERKRNEKITDTIEER